MIGSPVLPASSPAAAAAAAATADAAAAAAAASMASPTTVRLRALLRMIGSPLLPASPPATATALTMPSPAATRIRFRVPSAPTDSQGLRFLVPVSHALPQPFARRGTYTMPLMIAKSLHTSSRVCPSEVAAVWYPGKGNCRFFATLPNPGGSQWPRIYKEWSRISKQLMILLEKIVDFLRRLMKNIYYQARDFLIDWLYVIELGLRARAIEEILCIALWAVTALVCYMFKGTPYETLFEVPTEDIGVWEGYKIMKDASKMLEDSRKMVESSNKMLEGITKMLIQNEAMVSDATDAMGDLKAELDRVYKDGADKSNKIAELEGRVVDLEARIQELSKE